ncbi:MAG TPA: beta-glucosidase, partial [Verrucomicrobiae bacterium]|nr:beta-glucosidase [Verrucomicrobiae bacterium]
MPPITAGFLLTMGIIVARGDDLLPSYKNSALPMDVRVKDLLGRMTLVEKARQLDMYYGCETLLVTNPNQTIDRHTHAKPNAVFDTQFA